MTHLVIFFPKIKRIENRSGARQEKSMIHVTTEENENASSTELFYFFFSIFLFTTNKRKKKVILRIFLKTQFSSTTQPGKF